MIPELERFLDVYCGLPWEAAIRGLKARSGIWSTHAAEALERHQKSPSPIIVPKKREDRVDWYAIGFSAPQLRELREQLLAYIGPTYSDFRGRYATLNPEDPLEHAISELPNARVFRLSSSEPSKLREKIDGLLTLRENREFRRAASLKSVGAVVSDFDRALAVGNVGEAKQLLKTLDTQGLLDAQNIKYLEIKLYADTQRWGELLLLHMLDAVVMSRRPLVVTEAILRAIYHVHLAGRSEEDQIREMKMRVLPRFRPIFVALGPMRHPDVLNAFRVVALAEKEKRSDLRVQLVAIDGNIADELRPVDDLIPAAEQVSEPGVDAKAAIEQGNVERAQASIKAMSAGLERSMAQLEIYDQTSFTGEAVRAIEEIESLSEEDYNELISNPRYSALLSRALESPVPTTAAELIAPANSWLGWFAGLTNHLITPAQATSSANNGVVAWNILELSGSSQAFETALSGILGDATAEEGLYRAFPSLVRSLTEQDGFPRRDMVNVYQRLLQSLIGYLFRRNQDDLEAAIILLRAVLAAGIDDSDFDHLLQDVSHLIDEGLSPQTLPWCLDLASEFLFFPCPSSSRDRRAGVLRDFADRVLSIRNIRPEIDTDAQLRQFFQQCDFKDLLAKVPLLQTTGTGDALRSLTGTIAIYTLTESVASQARDILSALCPHAKIVTNSEKDGSKQLGELAQNADIFVVVTWSAKHAATEFIERQRSPREVLRPQGKGVSSLLRELRRYADLQAAT